MLTDEIILSDAFRPVPTIAAAPFRRPAVEQRPGRRIGHRTCVLLRLLLAHAGAGWPSWFVSRRRNSIHFRQR